MSDRPQNASYGDREPGSIPPPPPPTSSQQNPGRQSSVPVPPPPRQNAQAPQSAEFRQGEQAEAAYRQQQEEYQQQLRAYQEAQQAYQQAQYAQQLQAQQQANTTHQYPGLAQAGSGVPPLADLPAQNAPKAASGEPNFFKALFDFNFQHFVSIKFAKVIYLIGIGLNVLAWLGWTVFFFIVGAAGNAIGSAFGSSSSGGGMIVMGVLTLLFGWIFALLNVIVLRVTIEFVIAQVRTAQNTTRLAQRV